MPLFTNTQKLEIIHASVQRAMKEFNRRIDSSAVLTEGEQYSIKKARLKESARISTDKGLQEYLLALSSGLEMLKEFERYEKVKTGEARLTANNEQTEEIVQKRFLHAHQEVLSEHGSLVKEMLMKNSIVSDTKEMDSTTHRMNHLKAYVAKPDSVLRYNLVAKDAEEVEKTIRYARYKVIAGAMMKLLSWGLIALGLVIGVSSAVSTLVIGPAGFAGFALTLGLGIAASLLRKTGKKLMQTEINADLLRVQKSLQLFSKNENENKKSLPKSNEPSKSKSAVDVYENEKPEEEKETSKLLPRPR
jgi:hypothetical protein